MLDYFDGNTHQKEISFKFSNDNDKTDNDKTDNDKTDNDKTDNDKTDNDKNDNDKTDNDKTDNDKTDNDKTDNDKYNNDKNDNDKYNNNKTDNDKYKSFKKKLFRGNIISLDQNYYSDNRRLSENNSMYKNYKNNSIYNTVVKNFDLDNLKPQRAGVIMYTIIDNTAYFGMGLDTKTNDITDFGGGVSYKTDYNAIYGALREFQEETLCIFKKIHIDDIANSPVIYDLNNLIIFIYVELNPTDICNKFNEKFIKISKQKLNNKNEPEVCGIVWLNFEQLDFCIKTNGIMFYRVKKFLLKLTNIKKILYDKFYGQSSIIIS
jgi:hypothetical protein